MKPKIKVNAEAPAARKRMALYARVSTEEQTRGNYPSCTSQVEELEAECARNGWDVQQVVKDEGYSAGSLKRPGLTELRWLVESGQIDGVLCTWYDRLTRSREFYVLDNEFKSNGVAFITLHDPADTRTAAGRFMESMIVAAKTYERDQTSEKVRIKIRMRLEKGLHKGGAAPFGFTVEPETKMLCPQKEQLALLEQAYRVYVEHRSDFKVRDWLKAHNVPSPGGEAEWRVSTIRDMLCNRRYIGEVEINRRNKGVDGLPEDQEYRLAKAPHGPVIPLELWELAQSIRQEKKHASPNRVGRPRSFSQTQCGRLYPLQGLMVCGSCGHSMAPWYVHHKPGKHRRTESFVNYYVCAQKLKGWKQCDHNNLILASRAEAWIVERFADMATSREAIEWSVQSALRKCESQFGSERERLSLNKAALQENQTQIERMMGAITSGKADDTLLEMMNGQAVRLKMEREQLLSEQRQLTEVLQPVEQRVDVDMLQETFADFSRLAENATPEELQRLLRLAVRRVEWMPEDGHQVEFFCPPPKGRQKNWFYTEVCSGCPGRIRTSDPSVNSRLLYR